MIKSLDDFLDESNEKGHVVGTWGFNSNVDFSRMRPEETNVWFFEQMFSFLRSFFGLVLPDNLEIITYNASQRIEKKNLDQMTFLDELMLLIKPLKEPIWTARLNLNLVGQLRTDFDPENPIRLQFKEPASFIAWGGPDETGFENFSISYHLFSSTILSGDHMELWSMNQPLLEKALRKWEEQTGHMIEVVDSTGNAPTQRYGFGKPGSSKRGARQPLRRRVPPVPPAPPQGVRKTPAPTPSGPPPKDPYFDNFDDFSSKGKTFDPGNTFKETDFDFNDFGFENLAEKPGKE